MRAVWGVRPMCVLTSDTISDCTNWLSTVWGYKTFISNHFEWSNPLPLILAVVLEALNFKAIALLIGNSISEQ